MNHQSTTTSQSLKDGSQMAVEEELDAVLSNFGDNASCTRANAKDFWSTQSTDAPSSSDSIRDVCQAYAPMHLEKQFQQLYDMLHPSLVERKHQKNASAFLQGARGSGKSILLEQCLKAFYDELKYAPQQNRPPFRIVRLNGILVPGTNVSLVLTEILRQLSEAAQNQGKESTGHPPDLQQQEMDASPSSQRPAKRQKSQSAKELVRLRHTSFTNHIQLLNEILQFASLDDIPILFVLEELDAFIGAPTSEVRSDAGKDRQLLLYHLLDRVATGDSFVSLVGLTCHHGIMNMLEKRIRSRAEGTTQFVHLGPLSTITQLQQAILDKIQVHRSTFSNKLQEDIRAMLQKPNSQNAGDTTQAQVYNVLTRSLRLGHDTRWFCRVFYMALAAYRHDLIWEASDSGSQKDAPLSPKYVLDALVNMGGPFLNESSQHELVLFNDRSPDSRIQALRDLTGPQVALILSARRLLARDNFKESETFALTMDRMLSEYRTYRGSTNRYQPTILWKAFSHLVDVGLLQYGMDHSGRGAFQYEYDDFFANMPQPVLARLPLHLNVDIHRELKQAIQKKYFECSTALLEWGRKMN